MTDDTLPPWTPQTRLAAVRALATYLEAVEVCWRTKAFPVGKEAIKRIKDKEAATEDLLVALAGVGLAADFVPPVRPPKPKPDTRPDSE
jgi:hypothetical protein